MRYFCYITQHYHWCQELKCNSKEEYGLNSGRSKSFSKPCLAGSNESSFSPLNRVIIWMQVSMNGVEDRDKEFHHENYNTRTITRLFHQPFNAAVDILKLNNEVIASKQNNDISWCIASVRAHQPSQCKAKFGGTIRTWVRQFVTWLCKVPKSKSAYFYFSCWQQWAARRSPWDLAW